MNWDKEVRSLFHFHSKWMGYKFQIELDYGKTNVRRQYVYGDAAAAAAMAATAAEFLEW